MLKWDKINSPDFSNVLEIRNSASNSLQEAFKPIDNIITTYEKKRRDKKTNELINEIYNINDMEGLNTLSENLNKKNEDLDYNRINSVFSQKKEKFFKTNRENTLNEFMEFINNEDNQKSNEKLKQGELFLLQQRDNLKENDLVFLSKMLGNYKANNKRNAAEELLNNFTNLNSDEFKRAVASGVLNGDISESQGEILSNTFNNSRSARIERDRDSLNNVNNYDAYAKERSEYAFAKKVVNNFFPQYKDRRKQKVREEIIEEYREGKKQNLSEEDIRQIILDSINPNDQGSVLGNAVRWISRPFTGTDRINAINWMQENIESQRNLSEKKLKDHFLNNK